jgi:8-oxo-dGTP pyrophosphatase MutT (NUDIX family)
VIAADILAAVRARLAAALAQPVRRLAPLRVDGLTVGWLDGTRAARLAQFSACFTMRDDALEFAPGLATPAVRTQALEPVTRLLAAEGLLTAWRDERYAVAAGFGAPPLFLVERAAARFLGIHTYAAHVNGLVRRNGETQMWIGRRSATKPIDPSLLDNLVGGGIAAGAGVTHTLVKEAWEEAGIAPPLARAARAAGAVHIWREQPDGLQRETIFVHDLWLPAAFEPAGQDGEVVAHRLVPLAESASLIANATGPDVVTADASLVIVDCLLRQGAITPDAPQYLALEALRHPPFCSEPTADRSA